MLSLNSSYEWTRDPIGIGMTRIGMPVANARPIELSLVLFYIPRHVVCCDCIAIVWIAMGLVGLYEQRKQFLCV